MHLVTGVILAALAGKAKQNKMLQGLPMYRTGPLQIAHALPGRIRFHVPSLRDSGESRKVAIVRLSELKGIDSVTYSTVSGNILVNFDQELMPPPLLFSAMARLLGLEQELSRPVTPEVIKELRELGNSINTAVVNETYGMLDLRTIAIAGFVVLGIRKLVQEKWATVPTGLTLLWWAFNLVNRGHSS